MQFHTGTTVALSSAFSIKNGSVKREYLLNAQRSNLYIKEETQKIAENMQTSGYPHTELNLCLFPFLNNLICQCLTDNQQSFENCPNQ